METPKVEVDPASPVASTSSPDKSEKEKKNVVVLRTQVQGPFGPEQTFYLCGTSHVSKKTCEDVRELIRAVKPQVRFFQRNQPSLFVVFTE